MTKLDGKAALVSGSGRGIGRAIALKLAAEGARVVVNDLDAGPAAETVAAIAAAGGAAVACNGDVTADDFPDRFVAAALNAYGAIDIIVNNAGYTWDSVIQKTTDAQWQAMIDVHLTAPFRIMRAAAEFIRGAAKEEIAQGRPDVQPGRVRVALTAGKRFYRVTITDDGAGLPKEGRDRLTDPYVTNRRKGTGLGLAIVKKIVEQHGGELVLGDAPGVSGLDGAQATLRLPKPAARTRPPRGKPGTDPVAETGATSRNDRGGTDG